jgi:hypothetical protein
VVDAPASDPDVWINEAGEEAVIREVYEERFGGIRIRCVELENGHCWTARAFLANWRQADAT